MGSWDKNHIVAYCKYKFLELLCTIYNVYTEDREDV